MDLPHWNTPFFCYYHAGSVITRLPTSRFDDADEISSAWKLSLRAHYMLFRAADRRVWWASLKCLLFIGILSSMPSPAFLSPLRPFRTAFVIVILPEVPSRSGFQPIYLFCFLPWWYRRLFELLPYGMTRLLALLCFRYYLVFTIDDSLMTLSSGDELSRVWWCAPGYLLLPLTADDEEPLIAEYWWRRRFESSCFLIYFRLYFSHAWLWVCSLFFGELIWRFSSFSVFRLPYIHFS